MPNGYLHIPGAFAILLLLSAYVGFLPQSTPESGDGSKIPPSLRPNDKALHFVTFFVLSIALYWSVDTSRRRMLNVTLIVCTIILGFGSEALQALIPNGRSFDPFDVLANVVGSLGATGLCTWYHKRMLERRRKARFGALMDNTGGEDVELGITSGDADGSLGPQENGVTNARSLEEEVDNWDENAVDNWDEEGDEDVQQTDGGVEHEAPKAQADNTSKNETEDRKKRSD